MKQLKQWEHKDFCRMLKKNGFEYSHQTGSHCIYYRDASHISVPIHLNPCIALRLIKENQLITDIKWQRKK